MACTLIAEFGSSPAPDWNLENWIETAQWCGADAVKVQLFQFDHFPVKEHAQKAALEFPRHRWEEFVQLAHEYRLLAGASVFDGEAIRLVADHGDFMKVAAREQTNSRLLSQIATYNPKGIPLYRSVRDPVIVRMAGLYALGDVILLTIPNYPASLVASLLKVCQAARDFGEMKRAWGWSSHTTGWLDCWLARKLGASVIEKHFALHRTDLEAGHSLQPEALRQLKEHIR